MYGWIKMAFTVLAMFDYPYPVEMFELVVLPAYPVNTACRYLSETSNKIAGLAKATRKLFQT